jgi:TRAP-type C4-dicarboxylate transport system substrate-binding protein
MSGVGLAPLVGGLIITKQAWNKIPEPDRARMQEACKAAEKRLEVEIPKQDTTAIDEMMKRGLTVVPVPPGKMAEWRKAADDFAAQLRNGTVPPEILDMAKRERDAYRQQHAAGNAGK